MIHGLSSAPIAFLELPSLLTAPLPWTPSLPSPFLTWVAIVSTTPQADWTAILSAMCAGFGCTRIVTHIHVQPN